MKVQYSLFEILFRPLITFALRRGLKYQEVQEIVKQAFIGAAQEEIEQTNGEANVSQLSIVTGIQRRYITQIFEGSAAAERVNLLTKVIGMWRSNSAFRDARGASRRLTVEGADSEFAQLVALVSKDLNTYTILHELERAKLIERTSAGVRLLKEQYMPPQKDVAGALSLLARDLQALIQAVEQNTFQQQTVKSLHLTTQFDNIPKSLELEIKTEILQRGETFQKEIHAYLSKYDRDINRDISEEQDSITVTVGAFGSFKENIKVHPKVEARRGRKGKTKRAKD